MILSIKNDKKWKLNHFEKIWYVSMKIVLNLSLFLMLIKHVEIPVNPPQRLGFEATSRKKFDNIQETGENSQDRVTKRHVKTKKIGVLSLCSLSFGVSQSFDVENISHFPICSFPVDSTVSVVWFRSCDNFSSLFVLLFSHRYRPVGIEPLTYSSYENY